MQTADERSPRCIREGACDEGSAISNDLERGVLYLAANRGRCTHRTRSRTASSAGYPMALFKRAQVSVLLHEPDAASRIDAARTHADAGTRELILRERLFR